MICWQINDLHLEHSIFHTLAKYTTNLINAWVCYRSSIGTGQIPWRVGGDRWDCVFTVCSACEHDENT